MASLRSNPRWVVAVTAPQREKWASENVTRQGHEYYLPMCKERLIRGGKIVDVAKPMFPRYLFVRVTVQWRFLTGTFGVIGIILDGETPAIVDDSIIERIKKSEGIDGVINLIAPEAPAEPLPMPGANVLVTRGPMSGFVGQFIGKSGEDRVKILFMMFGRETKVDVGLNEFRVA
jgi:transcriptional antiterminator RfaH